MKSNRIGERKMKSKRDLYEEITRDILEELSKGVVPWKKPWIYGAPINWVNKRFYRGVNVLHLELVRSRRGYKANQWLTYQQARKAGGYVKKGEKASIVVFWKFTKIKVEDEDSEEKTKVIPFLRYYSVFNVDQCEGIEAHENPTIPEPVRECEKVIDGYRNRPEITHGGGRAFYRPSTDTIQVPDISSFEAAKMYYATLFHEAVHSTGHQKRLGRFDNAIAAFGSESYSKEELVAEMGAAFLSAMTGIMDEELKGHNASYIDGWRKAISEDKRLVVVAAGAAQKAVDHILGTFNDDSDTDGEDKSPSEPEPKEVEKQESNPKPGDQSVEFTVDAKDIRKALGSVKPAVPGKSTLPILTNVRLSANKQKLEVEVESTNIDTTIQASCSAAEIKYGGVFCVDFRWLEMALKGASVKGDIGIKYTDGECSISVNGIVSCVPALHTEDWPQSPAKPGTVIIKGLQDAVKTALDFASDSDTRRRLNGVYITNWNEDGNCVRPDGIYHVVATDGKKLIRIELRGTPVKDRFDAIVPLNGAKILTKLNGTVKAGTTGNRGYFEADVKLYTMLIEGEYPDYGRVIDLGSRDEKLSFETKPALDFIAKTPKARKNQADTIIRFGVTRDGLELIYQNQNISQKVKIPCTATRDMSFAFARGIIEPVLKNAVGAKVEFQFKDDLSPFTVWHDNVIMLAMPYKIDYKNTK